MGRPKKQAEPQMMPNSFQYPSTDLPPPPPPPPPPSSSFWQHSYPQPPPSSLSSVADGGGGGGGGDGWPRIGCFTPAAQDPPVDATATATRIPKILPHERVFPIQIGSELFKLSGASLSSDAPSYFSQYFLCQLSQAEESGGDMPKPIRTLCIDRDPVTFRDIALHLRGYRVNPRDSTHYVRLYADAHFYNLPKLISILSEETAYISVGHREFLVNHSLFTDPGNSPNYFTLGFGSMTPGARDTSFFGHGGEDLMRPPSLTPSAVPDRSADNFAELLHMLRGYQVEIRSETHRAGLIRDCKYFMFKGLEQRLIPHRRAFNPARARDEITIRLCDVLKSGISVMPDDPLPPRPAPAPDHPLSSSGSPTLSPLPLPSPPPQLSGWVHYARPYVDGSAAELVLETGGELTRMHIEGGSAGCDVRVEFIGDARTRITRLFEVIAAKLNLPPTTQPLGLLMAAGGADSQPATPGNTSLCDDDRVRVGIVAESSVTLDGRPVVWDPEEGCFRPAGAIAAAAAAAANAAAAAATAAANGASSSSAAAAQSSPSRKRRRTDFGPGPALAGPHGGGGGGGTGTWLVRTAQWRIRVQGSKSGRRAAQCVLVAVKIDAVGSERARNAALGFLA